MLPSPAPRDSLLPHQVLPSNPNSPFAANFNPAVHQIASLRQYLPPTARTHPMEEIEEKEYVNQNSRSFIIERCFLAAASQPVPRHATLSACAFKLNAHRTNDR